MIDESADVFLADFGLPCSKSGSAFVGIFDTPDQVLNVGGGSAMSTEYALTVKTSVVQSLALRTGVVIEISSVSYRIREALLLDDGLFTSLTLLKV